MCIVWEFGFPCSSQFKPLFFEIILQVDRGVKSPADISMNITNLVQTLNISPVSFKDGVKLTLAAEAKF